MMDIALILDILIAALLLLTISYCAVLMRKLNRLRSAQSELRSIIKGLGSALDKAEVGIAELRKAGKEAANIMDERIASRQADLAGQITKATELANDLEFMTDSGKKLANRLEVVMKRARTHQSSLSPESGTEAGPKSGRYDGVEQGSAVPSASVLHRSSMDLSTDPVFDWDELEDEGDDPEDLEDLGARSEVERDLLQALRQAK